MLKFVNYLQPIDAIHMRLVNRSVILEIIRQNNAISRSEISRTVGLSIPTVMRIVSELISDGLVRESGNTRTSNGRPSSLLEYNKNGYAVIGVDVGGTNVYGALANIGGKIIGEVRKPQHCTTAEESLTLVIELIQSLVDLSLHEGQRLLGIAVGAPGITHSQEGIVEWAPSLNWRDFPLKSSLEEHFHLPVIVENDVNLAVLGEQWFGAGKGVKNMVLITIGTGVGAGMIIDGCLYRGYSESAGEVGYLVSSKSSLGKRYTGFGALEEMVSGVNIAKQGRVILAGQLPADQLEELTAEDVFNAARKGETWACQIIDETVDYLSMALINIATIVDPELIILGGGVANSADMLIPPILKKIEGVIQHLPRLEASTLGPRAAVMGAITMTLHSTKDYYVVHRVS
jgi:glucokinase